MLGRRLAVADVVRRHLLDLGERERLRRADPHRDAVAGVQRAGGDDGRHAVLPQDEDRVRGRS